MTKSNLSKPQKFVVQPERTHFLHMLAKNPNYFGNIPGSKLKANCKLIKNTYYEELTCVGYNPDTTIMEATFSIKRPLGYAGNLCTGGSIEYVRFYLDYHDGAGFIDQGVINVNVHDIPDENDCKGKSTFPLQYVATLKREGIKLSNCEDPVLPTLRAILSWNTKPPADSPSWPPPWGNVMDCDVQLKNLWLIPVPFDWIKFGTLKPIFPELTIKQLAEISGVDISKLNPEKPTLHLKEFVKESKKLKVSESRFAYSTVQKMIKDPLSEMSLINKEILKAEKIDVNKLIDKFTLEKPIDITKANVDYEELECIGLDYNTESLVATISIKRKYGYSGDLCTDGSKEYAAFWIDWDDSCIWQYLDTVELNVHDIKMNGDCLCYQVTLPLDTKYHRKLCTDPNLVRIRGVLSWNVPPSTTDPNKLEYYGNRVDAHIQIRPGVELAPGEIKPLIDILGGIDVKHVDIITGLTKPDAHFAYTGIPVPTGAPFAGIIVINGPSFYEDGKKYRIKVTNQNDNSFYYLNNDFDVYGSGGMKSTQKATSDYYDFLPKSKNTLNMLAQFKPGTDDLLEIEMDIQGEPGTYKAIIQMDNTFPVVKVEVDDGGDCTHYNKGDKITGHFYVNDKYIHEWYFGSRWGGPQNGDSNTPGLPGSYFEIDTPPDAYPCGSVWVYARDKTIVNSTGFRTYRWDRYNICLQ